MRVALIRDSTEVNRIVNSAIRLSLYSCILDNNNKKKKWLRATVVSVFGAIGLQHDRR